MKRELLSGKEALRDLLSYKASVRSKEANSTILVSCIGKEIQKVWISGMHDERQLKCI